MENVLKVINESNSHRIEIKSLPVRKRFCNAPFEQINRVYSQSSDGFPHQA